MYYKGVFKVSFPHLQLKQPYVTSIVSFHVSGHNLNVANNNITYQVKDFNLITS